MRWLIVALMLINGVQLVLLQSTINATLSLDFTQTWTNVLLSFVALLLSGGLLAFAFLRGRGREQQSEIRVKGPGAGGRGTVSSDDLTDKDL
jgi:hypothetical protein